MKKRILCIFLTLTLCMSLLTVTALAISDQSITCTVFFHANGGTGTMESIEVVQGEILTDLPECGFTAPEGMEFDKWVILNSAGLTEIINVPHITNDCTVYALWKYQDGATAPEPTVNVSYLEYSWNDTNKELTSTTKSATATKITRPTDFGTTSWSGTYYISEDVTIGFEGAESCIDANGTVTLIIAPGKTLTIYGVVFHNETDDGTFTVYGQTVQNGNKGSLVISHTGGSTSAFQTYASLSFHGVNLTIANRTPEGHAYTVGPAIIAEKGMEVYGSTLSITSDVAAVVVLNQDMNVYDSAVTITALGAIEVHHGKMSIHSSALAITGSESPNLTVGLWAQSILLEKCIGSIKGAYYYAIFSNLGLEIRGSETNLLVETTLRDDYRSAIASANVILADGLKILDGSNNNAYVDYPSSPLPQYSISIASRHPNCADLNRDHFCDEGCGEYFGTHKDSNKDHFCDYGCLGKFGVCTDTNKDHICDYGCGKQFAYVDTNNDHLCDCGCKVIPSVCEDKDHDHLCDVGCGKLFGEHIDTNKDHKCDYGCKEALGACVDEDLDHYCDYGCGRSKGTHADNDHDHKCDYGCARVLSICKDANKDHECDICGAAKGVCADKNKDHKCDYGCDKKFGECVDEDHNHKCDYGCFKRFGICADADKDHYCDHGCGKQFGKHLDGNKDHRCGYGCETPIGEHKDTDHDGDCDYGCKNPIVD